MSSTRHAAGDRIRSVVLLSLALVAGVVAALAQLPLPGVPFGCGGDWQALPGLYRRLALQVAIAAAFVLVLTTLEQRTARHVLTASIALSVVPLLLAMGYYAFDAGLRNDLSGAPACGGAWTSPPLHALFWSMPASAFILDAVTTLALRKRFPRAWSVGWMAASVVALVMSTIALSGPVTS